MTSRVLLEHGSGPLSVPSTVLALSAQVETHLWNLLAYFNLRPFWCCLKIAAPSWSLAGRIWENAKRGGVAIDVAPGLANDPKVPRAVKAIL